MKRDFQSKVDALKRNRKERKRWYGIISALACITVFCTTYALCFPAMTMGEDDAAICGIKAHTHNEECYSKGESGEGMILSCNLTEHEHNADCFADGIEDIKEDIKDIDANDQGINDEVDGNIEEKVDDGIEQTTDSETNQPSDVATDDEAGKANDDTDQSPYEVVEPSAEVEKPSAEVEKPSAEVGETSEEFVEPADENSEPQHDSNSEKAEPAKPKTKLASDPLREEKPKVYVALNPGNGAGTSGRSDTANALFDYGNSPERVQLNVTNFIKGTRGTVKITLPSDAELDKAKVYIEGDRKTYTVKSENKYDYKLVGWYNIATGEYFDVSEGPITVAVNTKTASGTSVNNVFYADWIAASYDYGAAYSGSTYSTSKAESTNHFVTTKLYDFNELFNIYSAKLTQEGTTKETWTDKGTFQDTAIRSFAFQSYPHYQNGLGYLGSMKKWNQSGTTTDTVDNGMDQWNVGANGRDHVILNKLFDTGSSALGAHYVGEGDYLYHKEKDQYGIEYYVYDSHKNGASYNQSAQRFYVWDDLQYIRDSGGITSMFLPYNNKVNTTNEINSHDGSVNYWFGMTSEIGFYLPDDVKPGKSNNNKLLGTDNNLHDMIYSFSGDDDVWIFIDDKLVADLGGNHYPLGADINFGQGTMTYTPVNVWEGTDKTEEYFKRDKGRTHDLPELSKGYHSLKVFYLERGGGFSNLKIRFNIVDSPVGAMTVGKEILPKDSTVNSDVVNYVKDTLSYRYRVLQAESNGNIREGKLYIPANTEYTILDSRNRQTGLGVTDENGYFTLKSGQYARFEYDLASPPSPKYIVEETIPENLNGQYSNVKYVIGSGSGNITGVNEKTSEFVSYRTPAQKGDVEKKVVYQNILDTEELTWLTIEKRQSAGSDFDPDRTFTMKVKINGKLIPAGTHYLVRKTGKAEYTDMQVVKAGEIKIHVGETALLREGYPVDTCYEVTEVESEKCLPEYVNNKGVMNGSDAKAEVVVINKEIVTKKLLIRKEVMNEGKGTFEFRATIYDKDSDCNPRIVEFKLKHNESFSIDDIPMGAKVTVTETDSDGYVPLIKIGDGKFTLDASDSYTFKCFNEDSSILFYNSARYELPETGGTGTRIFTIAGFGLIAGALTGGFFLRRKKEGRE